MLLSQYLIPHIGYFYFTSGKKDILTDWGKIFFKVEQSRVSRQQRASDSHGYPSVGQKK